MEELAGRLAPLDPDAGSALRVVSYYDELLAHRGGLESVVRGAAVLSGAPARMMIPGWRCAIRILPDGRRDDEPSPAEAGWASVSQPDPSVTLWIERLAPPGPVDAVILERALLAARTVLERTPGRLAISRNDPATVEVAIDADAPPEARARAARQLGLTAGQLVRVVAWEGRPAQLQAAAQPISVADSRQRVGIGPAVPVKNAPDSAQAARLALRFASDADDHRVVHADDLGVLLLLGETISEAHQRWRSHPDVLAVQRAAGHAAWVLPTFDAVAVSDSLRTAAAILVVHHSTLQKRVSQFPRLLGWDVTTPSGRLRLQLALFVVRLTQQT
ncbi:helix-turn-helix domain-containing protein [Streptomyces griseorubiginosus]|uniref:PucR C-terminal helix-turn-helix domain-containing protein n=1 Tax=Streptomyces griseorubiginosus TaxID=67304 RepID=A0A101RMU9_9ACTN|nr:helix-turn-helix domain-containing protein [Streptomyces griseorubiginosus]KUN58532.1 hypothetical protein AQJ54_41545 [Streptomyces griseorubiginosus]